MTTWQFVDSIASSPTVLLDLNASPFFVDVNRMDLSPSDWDQSWASNSLIHGSRLVWEKAQNRVLFIPLHIMSSTVSAHETAITNLGNRLAQNGILKVQFGNSPIFFRTFGNPKYAMKIRRALQDSTSIDLTILAEPFGYGLRQEVSGSPFTLSNDPSIATGCKFDISGIQGDVSTPLLMVVTSTGSTNGVLNRWSHIATRRRGTPSNIDCVVQGEAMTLGTDASVVGSDSAMSGGSKLRVTPGTTGMVLRASDTFPANGTSGVDNRGEYLVYGRVAKTVAGDTWDCQIKYGSSSAAITASNDVQRCPAGVAGPFFLNLGKVPVPIGADPMQHGYSGVDMKALAGFIGFYAQRVAGTGNLDLDYLYFVPADDQTLIVKFPATDVQYAIDGTTDGGGAVYGMPYPAMDEVLTVNTPAQVLGGGGFPEATPGITTRVYWLRNIDPTGVVDAVANTTTIRVFYWPRWREAIRP